MKSVRWALLTSSVMAVAACGSHNHAPVVYGNDPSHQTRIYNSPDEIYREQRMAQSRAQRTRAPEYQEPVYQPPLYQPPSAQRSAAVEPVQLTPVSAVYLDEPKRAQPVSTASSRTVPAHLHKAKGYIEVQRGDTVYALARKFSVTPASIIDENDLRAPYALNVGQVLKLPSGSTVVATDKPARRVAAQDQLYAVRQGDTLYSISRASGVSVDAIASANRLRAPYALDVGQRLLVPQAPAGALQVATAEPKAPVPTRQTTTPVAEDVGKIARDVSYTPPPTTTASTMFAWPVRGKVVSEYGSGNLGRRNDGVNIAAPVGAPVRAAADGTVAYRGSELDGFGNLLLIKHADGFVTAYAHNDAMIVKKGDQVRKGQVIAKVGQTGAVTTPQLHFEIRQELKTVDPVALLGNP